MLAQLKKWLFTPFSPAVRYGLMIVLAILLFGSFVLNHQWRQAAEWVVFFAAIYGAGRLWRFYRHTN